jgi:hypothetical protein
MDFGEKQKVVRYAEIAIFLFRAQSSVDNSILSGSPRSISECKDSSSGDELGKLLLNALTSTLDGARNVPDIDHDLPPKQRVPMGCNVVASHYQQPRLTPYGWVEYDKELGLASR